jgi:hypothetical protein
MRWWIGIALGAASCTFGSAAGGGDDGGETGSSGTSTSSTDTGDADTQPAVDASGDEAPLPPDDTTTGAPADTGASDGPVEPTTEVCNGVDDDLDGATDEFSPSNDACGPCVYEVGPDVRWVYSFCGELLPQPDAELACQLLGGTLASIADEPTNDFIFDTMPSERHFIGYTDDLQEGAWHWTNAAPLTFERWAIGEPNDAGRGQDCAVMRDLGPSWDDVDCAIPHRYVCRGPL